jgi:phosphoglucomutase
MTDDRGYRTWKRYLEAHDRQGLNRLLAMDGTERAEAFGLELAFGTGGMRGVLGMGPGRMNRYTVERVTQALAQVALDEKPRPRIVLAYDTRHQSREFAWQAARVLTANGCAVHLFDEPAPTPALSFAVRMLGCDWGVVITASHNPKQYNGYKVYDRRGVQIGPETAGRIMGRMGEVEFFTAVSRGDDEGITLQGRGMREAYLQGLKTQLDGDFSRAAQLPLVYTPLYGSGAAWVVPALQTLGFDRVLAVQAEPDPDFGGVTAPNPEMADVYGAALEAARASGAALVLATDADSDRVGVQVRTRQGYVPLNGNQIGALLADDLTGRYLAAGGEPARAVVITTIVSGDMAEKLTRARGIGFDRVLTGFKYIADRAEALEHGGKRFLLGYEESYGYLSGSLARDKDAVWACCAIARMALALNLRGKTLVDRLGELKETTGDYQEKLITWQVEPLGFASRIERIMTTLREQAPARLAGRPLRRREDYLKQTAVDDQGRISPLEGLPPADVLKLYVEGGWVALRPSGTEPKIKVYVSALGTALCEALAREMVTIIGGIK